MTAKYRLCFSKEKYLMINWLLTLVINNTKPTEMGIRKTILSGLLILFSLSGCNDEDKAILNNSNFDEGDWLMVVQNEAEKTLFVIDDENVLKENPFGFLLGPGADCGGTTCDGFLELYKDGEMIAQQEFLSQETLLVSQDIKKAYRKAKQDWIDNRSPKEFQYLMDSLSKLKNHYPVRYHTQPEDKDIVHLFTYE